MRASALRRLLLVRSIGIAAILAFLGAAFFVERRVVQPLGWITTALERSTVAGVTRPSQAVEPIRAARRIWWVVPGAATFQSGSMALHDLHQRFDAAIANLPQGLCVLDRDLRLIICNSRYAELYGLNPAQTVPGIPLAHILHSRAASGYAPDNFDQYVGQNNRRCPQHSEPTKFIVQLQNSHVIEVSSRPLPDGGCVATHEDITVRRQAELQITYLANHDALTGLPNRALLNERMREALARVGRGEQAALLYLDLDNFKAINDLLGHPCGDALLRAVAERIRDCARATDTVARLGGDEFAVLQVGSGQPRAASELARRILEKFEVPFQLDGHEIHSATSIGLAVCASSGESLTNLMKCADLALYRAKAEGRGIYRFFEQKWTPKCSNVDSWSSICARPSMRDEFKLVFQPIVDLRSSKIISFEALIRWERPGHGTCRPSEFINVAEEIGAIIPIGEWVLREACREAMTWPEELNVSVNLSPVQFRTRSLRRYSRFGTRGFRSFCLTT